MQSLPFYDHPSAWRASDLQSKASVCIDLTPKQIEVLASALASVTKKELAIEDIRREHFDLSLIETDVQRWHDEIQHGKGLLVLTGWPSNQYSEEENAVVYWGLSTWFGEAQSQSLAGDKLGHVVGVGGKDPRERAYRNSTELALHTDASDIVGMMCLRPAKEGGLSGYCSGPAVYNYLLEHHEDELNRLIEGYYYHRFGEEAPGESAITEEKIPVFSIVDNIVSISYLRMYIDLAFRELAEGPSERDQRALDVLDDVAHSPEFRLNFMMESGDIAYFNNYVVLHTRTEFNDHDDPAKRRHLLRLWLKAHDARPVNHLIAAFTDRDGIQPQEGKTSYFEGGLDYSENIPHRDNLNIAD
ncbi:MAG: TauD/TfdA family dioxygenase [Pseudomonadota bacterium]